MEREWRENGERMEREWGGNIYEWCGRYMRGNREGMERDEREGTTDVNLT